MNKNDLINAVAKKAHITKQDSERAVNAAIDAITGALVTGEKVQITGFGSFEVKVRAARTGRNPQTNEPIEIAPRRAPVFRAGRVLKDAIF